MKTTRLLGYLATLSMTLHASAQVDWSTGGNTINGTEWFGADGGSTIPLEIRHDADQPIQFFTDGLEQMRLLNPETYTIGSFLMNRTGLLLGGVSQFYTEGAPGPYSLLHITADQDNAQQASFRPWMGVGLTLTGNADHSYFGQKVGEQLDYTDVVLHWSDNPTKQLKDRMRFIFTSGYEEQATTGATSLEGLEAMRLYPVDNDNVNVGIGDFYAGNLLDPTNVIEPTERLDVLDGRVRIRQLPTDADANTLNRYMVVDNNGVVHWRTLPPAATPGCEWDRVQWNKTVISGLGAPDPNSTCPDRGWGGSTT